MGKYDEVYAKMTKEKIALKDYWLHVIANELAEKNRLTRQKLCTKPGAYYDKEEMVDKA